MVTIGEEVMKYRKIRLCHVKIMCCSEEFFSNFFVQKIPHHFRWAEVEKSINSVANKLKKTERENFHRAGEQRDRKLFKIFSHLQFVDEMFACKQCDG